MKPTARPTTRFSRIVLAGLLAGALGSSRAGAQTPPPADEPPSLDELFEAGKALFDEHAPEEIKAQYRFPSKAEWNEFVGRLQGALASEDLAALADYEPEARAALGALRLFPEYADYADWLQERLDYIEAARPAASAPPVVPTPRPPGPGPAVPATRPGDGIPHYDLWVGRLQDRARPPRADKFLPTVRAAFTAEGVPAEIAWLAETESTFNPEARSPAGAKGLFQLMPQTAKGLGLKTFLPDERADAEKSAHAAARYLRELHGKFGDWPLTFAAYNAGEGRVRRLLKDRGAESFAGIASALPSETRMYVPKVLATIAVRAGVAPEKLLPPTG